jgi:hypothetical protein
MGKSLSNHGEVPEIPESHAPARKSHRSRDRASGVGGTIKEGPRSLVDRLAQAAHLAPRGADHAKAP